MFDYPISVPRDTLYTHLGVRPDATPDEINMAIEARTEEIRVAQRRVAKRLKEVDDKFPELATTRTRLEGADREHVSDEEKGSIRAELVALEREAEEFCPEYRRLLREKDELDKRRTDLNALPIQKPKGREEYDLEHPPLRVLRLADHSPDLLGAHPDVLPLLRAEVSQFLEEQGETVFHPTDVTRRDFAGDLTPTPLLDGEEP